jgi:hypothetical protein
MMEWQKWIPSRKVTAATFGAAVALVIVWLLNRRYTLSPVEAFALGSAFAVVVAYLVPERDANGTGPNRDENGT